MSQIPVRHIYLESTSRLQHYNNDQFTRSYNASVVREALTAKYGQRYVSYREAWARSEKYEVLPFPINFAFDIINACNLACPMCLRSEKLIEAYQELKLSKQRLTLEQMTSVLDEGHQHGLPSVNIGMGGECTLHPDLLKFCAMVMEREVMEFRLITNGLRLTRDIAEALVELQVHILSVSVDAFSPEVYSKVRGEPEQYEGLLENITSFLEVRKKRRSVFPLLRVSFTPQPDNVHETRDFVSHWVKKADLVDIQTYHEFGATHFSYDFECTEPFRRLAFWASGKIGPCCGFPGIEYEVGTLGSKPLGEVWWDEPIARIRRMLIDKSYSMMCLKCQGSRTDYLEDRAANPLDYLEDA